MSEWWKLLGIAIVVVGLALRLRPTMVVVTAGLVTGLLSGLPLFSADGMFAHAPALTRPNKEGIIDMLGRAFIENRLMTLFIITLPAIGLAEKYGLQEQAAALIRRISAATVGRLQIVYQLFRVVIGALGLRLNGHPSFVRPLIFPMSLGAAAATAHVADPDEVPTEHVEEIKAATAASENYGNFYGQNLSPVQPGILLVFGVLKGLGYDVSIWSLVLYTTPIVIISVVLGAIQFALLDRRYRRAINNP
ncbi:MAG: DUF969 domain-containing protein [Armatimonadota bacterium]|nr:DUF969 domain-containing protein [Armatimonadota bacterium]